MKAALTGLVPRSQKRRGPAFDELVQLSWIH
jgi:hypothetical protein